MGACRPLRIAPPRSSVWSPEPGDAAMNGLQPEPGDWTLQWILTAGDHLDYTGDLETVEAVFPSILKALAWFERLIGPSGLVADMPYWHFMDWAGVGREGEAGALNAQLAGSFRVAAKLARARGWERAAERRAARGRALGGERAAERCAARAHSLARALNGRHWDDRRGAYVDIVDPVSGAQDLRMSQHANAAMALWGEAPADRIRRALDRISDSSRLTFPPGPPIAPHGQALEPEGGVVL